MSEVFLTVRGTQRPLGVNNHLGSALKSYYRRAGLRATRCGAHPIRHAFATRLMEQGTPLKHIADLLGHRSIESTFLYTKVDLERLRMLAAEWPGGESMKARLTGPLGNLMKRHLQLRRSLGYELRTAEIALDQFDAYAAGSFPNSQTVTRAMITGYLQKISDLHPVTRHSLLSVLRQFCRFLFQLDPTTYIPEGHLLPAARSDFHPHIYTLEEVMQLMDAALRLPPAGSLRPHTYSTLIGLLWVSGLRGGELVRLNVEDVDLEKGVLHIRQTKNFKSRLVPLTDSARMALMAYRDVRARLGAEQVRKLPSSSTNANIVAPAGQSSALLEC